VPEPSSHSSASRPLGAAEADELAETMGLFAAPSRLRLLWQLLDGERSVDELAQATGMSQSAVSQQLRVLRQGRLVTVRRSGRWAFYSLHDHHLPALMAALRHHLEHVSGRQGADRNEPSRKAKQTAGGAR
jgi:DNA-binding transcriptional ArsR family regulator